MEGPFAISESNAWASSPTHHQQRTPLERKKNYRTTSLTLYASKSTATLFPLSIPFLPAEGEGAEELPAKVANLPSPSSIFPLPTRWFHGAQSLSLTISKRNFLFVDVRSHSGHPTSPGCLAGSLRRLQFDHLIPRHVHHGGTGICSRR